MPTWYPEGNLSLPSDDKMRSLHKICDLLGGGTGTFTGGGSGAVLIGDGAPNSASIPTNKTAAAVYYQRDNAYAQWVWDTGSQAWV